MNSLSLRRIAIIGAALTVLLAIDSIYMFASHYKEKDDVWNFHLNDGGAVLIAAILLLILTIVTFVLSNRSAAVVETKVPAPVEAPAEAAAVNEPADQVKPEVQG